MPDRAALEKLAWEVVWLVRETDSEEGPSWAMIDNLEGKIGKEIDKLAPREAKLVPTEDWKP